MRGTRVVVTGEAPRSTLRQIARRADRAAAWVTRLWGPVWADRHSVQIYLPRTERQFVALGGSRDAQVSATTTPAGDIVLRPVAVQRLTAQGQVVVLAHELTHVALHQTRATGTPKWVTEGSAELTAYRPTGIDLAQAAPQVGRAVRQGHPPDGPPADAVFSGSDLRRAYQEAYVWCTFLVDRYGLAQFTAFVRDADRPRSRDREPVFRAAFDTTPHRLRTAYRSWLQDHLAAHPDARSDGPTGRRTGARTGR